MDRKELKEILKPFFEACAAKGRPLDDIYIEEAYPGDISTSFIVNVKSPWIDEISCSEAIHFLFVTLFETMERDVRRKIFTIRVLGSKEEFRRQKGCTEMT